MQIRIAVSVALHYAYLLPNSNVSLSKARKWLTWIVFLTYGSHFLNLYGMNDPRPSVSKSFNTSTNIKSSPLNCAWPIHRSKLLHFLVSRKAPWVSLLHLVEISSYTQQVMRVVTQILMADFFFLIINAILQCLCF